MKKTANY